MAAGNQGIEAAGTPGAEEGSQGHLAGGAAADLPADYQGAQTSLGSVVVRRHGGFGDEDEQFLDELRNAPAQLALHRRWVIQESAAAGQQFTLQPQLDPPPLPLIGMGEGLRLGIDFMDCRRPPGQPDVLGVEGLQVVDVPQLLGTSGW